MELHAFPNQYSSHWTEDWVEVAVAPLVMIKQVALPVEKLEEVVIAPVIMAGLVALPVAPGLGPESDSGEWEAIVASPGCYLDSPPQ